MLCYVFMYWGAFVYMKIMISVLAVFILSSCSTSGYKKEVSARGDWGPCGNGHRFAISISENK